MLTGHHEILSGVLFSVKAKRSLDKSIAPHGLPLSGWRGSLRCLHQSPGFRPPFVANGIPACPAVSTARLKTWRGGFEPNDFCVTFRHDCVSVKPGRPASPGFLLKRVGARISGDFASPESYCFARNPLRSAGTSKALSTCRKNALRLSGCPFTAAPGVSSCICARRSKATSTNHRLSSDAVLGKSQMGAEDGVRRDRICACRPQRSYRVMNAEARRDTSLRNSGKGLQGFQSSVRHLHAGQDILCTPDGP